MRLNVLNSSSKDILKNYTINLNEKAKQNKIDPVIGRDKEIVQLSSILLKRTKNNPLLIGEAGVGKTAIAEEFARKIVRKEVHDDLIDKEILTLDTSGLLAGTRERGSFEEKMTNLFSELDELDNVILFIDEIHTVVGKHENGGGSNSSETGQLNFSNLLKPRLARGDCSCIGSTTLDEYNKYFITDKAFERRFRPIYVEEPTISQTIDILKSNKNLYAEYHNCVISDSVIEHCVFLSYRYIHYRNFPDKSIDLLDETCSKVKLEYIQNRRKDSVLTKSDFESVIQQCFNVNFDIVEENTQLEKLKTDFDKSIIGHDDVKNKIINTLKRYKCGFYPENRPIATFLFIGSTGIGKTEMANVLGRSYFGNKDNIIRLDMSEYMEPNSVSKLIGSPPGYVGFSEGGYLTNAIKNNPHTIVLLDEIEKAHYKIFDIFLQIFEYGELTDSFGKTFSFKNSIIIMTSNVGNDKHPFHGFDTDHDISYETNLHRIDALKQVFKPEFLNRIDEIVLFNSLTPSQLKEIADNMLQSEILRIKDDLDINLIVSKNTKQQIYDSISYDDGARNIRISIQKYITDNLSYHLLEKKHSTKSIIV
jgi:ATP-dependent Clp protease ATP-binding subunit ClpC